MIETLGVLIVILVALLGGFWQFVKIANKNKVQYQQDAMAMRSTIVSSELVPHLVLLIEKVEGERSISKRNSIEQILSRSSFAFPQIITRAIGKINDVKTVYLQTIKSAFKCAYDLLIMSVLPALTIVWIFLDVYWEQFILLSLFGGSAILIKTIYDVLKYTSAVRQFIDKDNEIRLGRSTI